MMINKQIAVCVASFMALTGCVKDNASGDYSNVKVGDRVPAFSIADTAGNNVYNSRTETRPVLIYFLWSECGDCHNETPEVLNVYDQMLEEDYEGARLICMARGGDYASLEQAKDYWAKVKRSTGREVMPPLYYDRGRVIYDMFAKQGVPRFCTVGDDGLIKWYQEGLLSAATLAERFYQVDPEFPAVDVVDYSYVKAGDDVPIVSITDVNGTLTYDSATETRPTLLFFFNSESNGTGSSSYSAILDAWKQMQGAAYDGTRFVCVARGGSNTTQEGVERFWAELGVSGGTDPMPPLYYDSTKEVFNEFAKYGSPRYCIVDDRGVIAWHVTGNPSLATLTAQLKAVDPAFWGGEAPSGAAAREAVVTGRLTENGK